MSFIGTYPTNTIKRVSLVVVPPPLPTLVSITSTSPFLPELELGYQTILKRPHRYFIYKRLWGLLVSSFREYALTVGLSLEIPDIFSNFQDIVKFSIRKAKELLGTTIIEEPGEEAF